MKKVLRMFRSYLARKKRKETKEIINYSKKQSEKMIIEKTQFKKYKYLVAFPNIQLVDSYDDLEGFDSIWYQRVKNIW